MKRVVIIGAGPAGNYGAFLLAKSGYEVVVFEEHPKIGLPFQCTGILTHYLSTFVDPTPVLKDSLTTFRVRAGDVETDIAVDKPNLVLCRTSFDQYLADMAKKAGAKFHLQHRFLKNKDGIAIVRDVVSGEEKEIPYDYLIGADGPNSAVARANDMLGKRTFWVGAQCRARIKHDHVVEIYPHLGVFGWVVPEGDGIVRVGVYAKHGVKKLFDQLLEERGVAPEDIIDQQGGPIPEYHPSVTTQKGNVYLVGDAALQVKATTGGGIIPSLKAARCLHDALVFGRSYEREWRKRMGLDLRLHLWMHKVLERFREEDWKDLIRLMSSKKAQEVLATHDREYPSKFLVGMIMAEPRLLKFAKVLLRP